MNCIHRFIFGKYLMVANTSDIYCKYYSHLRSECHQTICFSRILFFCLIRFRLAVRIESCLVHADPILQEGF